MNSDTPRTDSVVKEGESLTNASALSELAMHARTLERELAAMQIFEFNEERIPQFTQGGTRPQHELEEVVTAERCAVLVAIIAAERLARAESDAELADYGDLGKINAELADVRPDILLETVDLLERELATANAALVAALELNAELVKDVAVERKARAEAEADANSWADQNDDRVKDVIDQLERAERAEAALAKIVASDKLFHDQVQAALDDPRPSVAQAEVSSRWQKNREQLLKKIKEKRTAIDAAMKQEAK